MPQYALDAQNQIVIAKKALREATYSCLECKQTVKLRGGPYKRPHFFHLCDTHYCRQNQKGPIHQHLQAYMLKILPLNDCILEHPFPSIRRIADVAWLSAKIVFEIQYSPISAEEVIARNRDYHSLGWSIVWILHDDRYNQMRVSAAEMALRSSPHFFSNMNSKGVGIVYDQFDICDKGFRKCRLESLPVQLNTFVTLNCIADQKYPLEILKQREIQWRYSFKGDLYDVYLQNAHAQYLKDAEEKQNEISPMNMATWRDKLYWICHKMIFKPYRFIFRFFLEKMCR